jgi:hypothetical protein
MRFCDLVGCLLKELSAIKSMELKYRKSMVDRTLQASLYFLVQPTA